MSSNHLSQNNRCHPHCCLTEDHPKFVFLVRFVCLRFPFGAQLKREGWVEDLGLRLWVIFVFAPASNPVVECPGNPMPLVEADSLLLIVQPASNRHTLFISTQEPLIDPDHSRHRCRTSLILTSYKCCHKTLSMLPEGLKKRLVSPASTFVWSVSQKRKDWSANRPVCKVRYAFFHLAGWAH